MPPSKVDPILQLKAFNDQLCRDRLAPYIRTIWPLLEDTDLVWNWHIDMLAEALEAVEAGDVQKLLINVPPGHFKSSSINVALPTHVWSRDPSAVFINVMYGDAVARKEHRRRRRILESPWYQAWSGLKVDDYAKLDEHVAENRHGGVMYAASIHGAGTGYHADFLIADDPLNADDVRTVELHGHVETYKDKWQNRLRDVQRSAQIVVMQRLHTDDLAGVLDGDPTWHVVRLPARYDPQKARITVPGLVDPREPGEPLFPARFPAKYLDYMESAAGMGRMKFSAQYQQSPVAGAGNIVDREWWRYWRDDVAESHPDALPDEMDVLVASWDLTFKAGKGTDFVVGQVWGRKGNRIYLLDQVRARLSFTETRVKFREWAHVRWPDVTRWLVEEKANGAAILDELRHEVIGLIPVRPKESKEERLHAVAGLIQSGCVYLPSPDLYPWVDDVLDEVSAFPLSANDDQVDAMTQALRDLSTRARSFTVPAPVDQRPLAALGPASPLEERQQTEEEAERQAEDEAAQHAHETPAGGGNMPTARKPPWEWLPTN